MMTKEQRIKYQHLYDTMQIKDLDKVFDIVNLIQTHKYRYEELSKKTGIPWYFIGLIHYREASCEFDKHLHNGDPLTARTVHVPKGRPAHGNPPFKWDVSALDALEDYTSDTWDIPNILYEFERYNGFGYKYRGINSPYLWGGTNHYSKGLFVRDHVFDPNKKWTGVGCAPVLKIILDDPKEKKSSTTLADTLKGILAVINKILAREKNNG